MNLERLVQIHVGLLATIGAMLLGVARGDGLLPLLVVFAAATSLLFTDSLNWLRLNRGVANLLALIALFSCLNDFFDAGVRGQLLAVANLLIYLQVILFYQRKTDRLYWQLIVLSLLQVVVSAALNVPVEFGILLMVYAALAISTLTFFFLHREVVRVVRLARGPVRQREAAQSPEPREPGWRRLLDRSPKVHALLSGRRIIAELRARGLASQIVVMGVTTLVFSLVLFYSAPRAGVSWGRAVLPRAQNLVGFSPEVTLNELSRVLESDEMVMRISFRDLESGEAIRISGDPYIRGAVLTDYALEPQGPVWRQRSSLTASFSSLAKSKLSNRLLAPPPGRALVRQDIALEPVREPLLFAVYPTFRLDETPDDVILDPITERLESQLYRETRERREYRYRVATTAFRGGVQVNVVPHAFRHRDPSRAMYLAQEKQQLLAFDAYRFPRLKELADEIGDRQRRMGASRADLARALRDHFLAGNGYSYTLDFTRVKRDPRLDPIEDFVANHRSGHCEYYASALVMMLRSQGIPARMIVGFHCGEYNLIGGYYQVRQRHAHAWAEAFLEPEDVPQELPPDSDTSPYGGWLRLDATPGADIDRAAQYQRSLVNVMDEFLDYAEMLWTDYVLGLTAKRQQESIYAPVSDKTDPEALSASWRELVQQFKRFVIGVQVFLVSPPMRMALLVLLLLVMIWLAIHLRRFDTPPRARRASSWRAFLTGQSPALDERAAIAQRVVFYRRFERLLAKLGLVRRPGQTPREFASSADIQYEGSPERVEPATQFPQMVADAFYRIRFGDGQLSAAEQTAIDEGLAHLEQLVAQRESQPKPASGRPA